MRSIFMNVRIIHNDGEKKDFPHPDSKDLIEIIKIFLDEISVRDLDY